MRGVWESLRILLVIALTRKYAKKLGRGNANRLAAFILSILSHKVLQNALDKILQVVFNYEPTTVMDEWFSIDKPRSHSNSISVTRLEKVDGKKFKLWLRDEFTAILPRAQHKLVTLFGRKYYAPLT